MTRTLFLTAEHAERGDLWAAWNPDIRHVEPGVRCSRFSARLAPFTSEDDARHALVEAGGVLVSRHG